MTSPLVVTPILGLPEVVPGTDLSALLAPALAGAGLPAGTPRVLVLSSKVCSKALGLRAPATDKDALIADETVRVVAERRAGDRVTRIVQSAAGPVMAAAGVDASNVGGDDVVLLLPRDADRICRELRSGLLAVLGRPASEPMAVVLSDTAGRPWRGGVVDFALGSAGITPLLDHRGELDADGRPMAVTVRCPVDELAAAADLVKGKASGIPAAVVTGAPAHWFDADASGAGTVVRTGPGDWFAVGHVEAVRAALGVAPGSAESLAAGLPSVGALDPVGERVTRAVSVALDSDDVAVDVEPDAQGATLTVGGDPVEAGRVIGRLEVAAWAESLRCQRVSDLVVRLSDAAAVASEGASAGSSGAHAADGTPPQP